MYEITFHYYEEIRRGEYNRDESKSRTIKVGTPEEDTPLETAASKIISQMARRNILVHDVEIYEFTKKKLSFKETPDGISIKNKKFKFDDGPTGAFDDIQVIESGIPSSIQPPPIPPPIHQPQVQPPPVQQQVPQQGIINPMTMSSTEMAAALGPGFIDLQQELQQLKEQEARAAAGQGSPNQLAADLQKLRDHVAASGMPERSNPKVAVPPSRFEYFSPPKELMHTTKGRAFTVGRRYPIYGEKWSGDRALGALYKTIDDRGVEMEVSERLFVPVYDHSGFGDSNLVWPGLVDGKEVNLR